MQRIFYKIIILNIVFTIWSCGNKEKLIDDNKTQEITFQNNRIKVLESQFTQSQMEIDSLKEMPFPTIIKANGIIDVPPENKAIVSAIMGGYIKTTPLLVGDAVKKGQLLVTLENPEFVTIQQQYMEINGQLSYLKAEFERQKTLIAEQISSQKNYLKAESEYKTALAKFNGLRKQLEMLHIAPSNVESGKITSVVSIYAPISGSITKVNVVKGAYVSPASSILEIIDNDHIHLELSVFEKDIMKVKKEQKIEFKIPEASSKKFKAEVHLVGTTIDKNRTIKVHGHMENESENNFLTGMFVDASIITSSKLEKALPNEAIITIDDTSYVLVLDKKQIDSFHFMQKEVNIGESYNGYTQINNISQFKPDSQFLTKGIFNLLGE
tara:strand:+ start:18333 stop:19478 length:1146 start_codon:yes stop_codon:yes gene_type:complete